MMFHTSWGVIDSAWLCLVSTSQHSPDCEDQQATANCERDIWVGALIHCTAQHHCECEWHISHQLLMATSIIPSTSFSPTQLLSSTVQLFLNPVRVNGLLPSDAITDIFANIEGILSVNGELFSCMRQHSLADAFTYLGPFLKLYSTYANNYQQALQSLQVIERVVRKTMWASQIITILIQASLKHNHKFARFIASQESKPECNKLTLTALLLTPVQRIPRCV